MSTAGWYPDPNDPAAIRFFDGEAWTDHVQAHPNLQPQTPAAPQTAPTPPTPPTPPTTQTPTPPIPPTPVTRQPEFPGSTPAGTGAPAEAGTGSGRIRRPRSPLWLGFAIALLLTVLTPWFIGPSSDGLQALWPLPTLSDDTDGILSFWFQFAACLVAATACLAVIVLRATAASIVGAVICLLTVAVTGLNSVYAIAISAEVARLQSDTIGLDNVESVLLPGPGVILPTIGSLIGVIASLAMLQHVGARRRGAPSTSVGSTSIGSTPAGAVDAPPVPAAQPGVPVHQPAPPPPAVQPTPGNVPRAAPRPSAGSFGPRTPEQYGQW